MAIDFPRLNRRFGPWVALASGVYTVASIKQGATFAPIAASALLAAWTLTAGLARFLPPRQEDGRLRRLARFAAKSLASNLNQTVLFFLLPLWFGSATWPSVNLVVPAVLGAWAIYSCFDELYFEQVLAHPIRRAAACALVLCATLVPAGSVLSGAPLTTVVVGSAVTAALLAGLTTLPLAELRSRRGPAKLLLLVVAAAGIALLITPILPPVPVQLVRTATATGVEGREPAGAAITFPSGTARVVAWFAIAAPARYRQAVTFSWRRDGAVVGRPFQTTVVGGRRDGFRTWAEQRSPGVGAWTVELETDSGQLIGRAAFEVR